MRSRLLAILSTTAAVLMLSVGALEAVNWLGGTYILKRTASDTCMNEPSPPGAVMYEGAFADSSSRVFPVAGTVCTWNRADDSGTFDTLIPNDYWTITGWVAAVGVAAGTAGLIVAIRRRFPPPGARS